MEIADLRAITSGLSSKAMGSARGGEMVVWSGWEWVKSGRSREKEGMEDVAREGEKVGVRGEIGGCAGDSGAQAPAGGCASEDAEVGGLWGAGAGAGVEGGAGLGFGGMVRAGMAICFLSGMRLVGFKIWFMDEEASSWRG